MKTKEPVLLIMAAGMGSRYGGLKQMDPVGPAGELIVDFSLYDALKAGFKKAVFIIKKEMESDFRELIDKRAGRFIETEYAFQELDGLPAGYSVPPGREKPWGTCHAVLSARHLIDSHFAVINADDFYGADAFRQMYSFLDSAEDYEKINCCMIGYKLENTLAKHGHVARGICDVSYEGYLTGIVERTKVLRRYGKTLFTEDDEKTWNEIKGNPPVSMNFWGFSKAVLEGFAGEFTAFLDAAVKEDPLKAEFLLPFAVGRLIAENKADVKVMMSADKWYGVTYREDGEDVTEALQSFKDEGIYPETLWK